MEEVISKGTRQQISSTSRIFTLRKKHFLSKLVVKLNLKPPRATPKKRVGVGGPLPKTLTLFMTKFCEFPNPIYELTKNLIPYL